MGTCGDYLPAKPKIPEAYGKEIALVNKDACEPNPIFLWDTSVGCAK